VNIPLIKPPKATRIPDIVTVDQAQQLFQSTRKLSYRVFFFTLYSLGLRLGEGLRVHIPTAKGNKDRLVPLPSNTLLVLRRFWRLYRHPTLIFPNRKRGLSNAYKANSPLDRGGVQTTIAAIRYAIAMPRIGWRQAWIYWYSKRFWDMSVYSLPLNTRT
jgi:integrase/recombinase XerD